MSQSEALELLTGGKEGIAEWNRRRLADNQTAELAAVNLAGVDLSKVDLDDADLSDAYLVGVDLVEANLAGANLSGANLAGANLAGAKLSGANLFGADLTGANLVRADLLYANLARSDLSGADLSEANLARSDLSGADLSGANLTKATLYASNFTEADLTETNVIGAHCGQTIFGNVDLSTAIGLGEILHSGPSTIGIDTLLMSEGQIPESFLRGCGVPEQWIEYLPSLISSLEPIQFYSCFISHSSKDDKFVARLHSRMIQEKIRVWYAPEDMRGGRKSIDQIDQAIRLHDKLLLVLSKASMGSDWVKHEVIKAIEREKAENRQILFPISLVSFNAIKEWKAFDSDLGRDIAKEVREYHIPYFAGWKDHDTFESEFAKLLIDLKTEDTAK